VDSAGIAAIPLFADLPEEERERVADVCAHLGVGAGETPVITVMNRDVWRLEREVREVSAALRATIARCLEAA
jgi:hypothetical protein